MGSLVAVDIGGTHARFAEAEVDVSGSVALGEPTTLQTRDHASFQTAWEHYVELRGGEAPESVAIAIAAPVEGEVIRFTNNPWIIRPRVKPPAGLEPLRGDSSPVIGGPAGQNSRARAEGTKRIFGGNAKAGQPIQTNCGWWR